MTVDAIAALIVLTGGAVPILIVWLVQRGKLARMRATAGRVAASDARIATIETRLAALETIVLDPGERLAREIALLERAA